MNDKKRSLSKPDPFFKNQSLLYERLKYQNEVPKFRRGSMTFEDYNYKAFNKYILVDKKGNTLDSSSSNSVKDSPLSCDDISSN